MIPINTPSPFSELRRAQEELPDLPSSTSRFSKLGSYFYKGAVNALNGASERVGSIAGDVFTSMINPIANGMAEVAYTTLYPDNDQIDQNDETTNPEPCNRDVPSGSRFDTLVDCSHQILASGTQAILEKLPLPSLFPSPDDDAISATKSVGDYLLPGSIHVAKKVLSTGITIGGEVLSTGAAALGVIQTLGSIGASAALSGAAPVASTLGITEMVVMHTLPDRQMEVKASLRRLQALYGSAIPWHIVSHLIRPHLPPIVEMMSRELNISDQEGLNDRCLKLLEHEALAAIVRLSEEAKRTKGEEERLTLRDLVKVVESSLGNVPAAPSTPEGPFIALLAAKVSHRLVKENPTRDHVALTTALQTQLVANWNVLTSSIDEGIAAPCDTTRRDRIIQLYCSDALLKLTQRFTETCLSSLPVGEREESRSQVTTTILDLFIDFGQKIPANKRSLFDLRTIIERVHPRHSQIIHLSYGLFGNAFGKNYDYISLRPEGAVGTQVNDWCRKKLSELPLQELLANTLLSFFTPHEKRERELAEVDRTLPTGGLRCVELLSTMIAQDVVPSLFHKKDPLAREDATTIAEQIVNSLKDEIEPRDRSEAVEEWAKFIAGVQANSTVGSAACQNVIQEIAKDIFSHLGANFARLLAKADSNRKRGTKELFLGLTEITARHFKEVHKVGSEAVRKSAQFSRTTTALREEALKEPRKSDYRKALQAFASADLLQAKDSPGQTIIPLNDLDLSEEERKNHRIEHFYRPLCKRLRDLLAPEGSVIFNLPPHMNDRVRHKIWKQLTEEELPNILYHLVTQLNDPKEKRELFLKAVNAMNSPDGEETAEASEEVATATRSAEQRALDEAAGKLIKEFSALLPNNLGNVLLQMGGVKKKVGAAVGEAPSSTLSTKGLSGIVDQAFASMDETVRPNGLYSKRRFSLTQQERFVKEREARIHERRIDAAMVNHPQEAFRKALSMVQRKMKERYWDAWQARMEKLLEHSPKLLAVKHFFDSVSRFLFLKCLLPLVKLLTTPIRWPLYFYLERYGSNKIQEAEELLHHPINEVLMMRYLEHFVRGLEPMSSEPTP